jgi:hypothetical protein
MCSSLLLCSVYVCCVRLKKKLNFINALWTKKTSKTAGQQHTSWILLISSFSFPSVWVFSSFLFSLLVFLFLFSLLLLLFLPSEKEKNWNIWIYWISILHSENVINNCKTTENKIISSLLSLIIIAVILKR